MARKGQFKKGGGRVGGASRKARRSSSTKTIVVRAPARTRTVTRYRSAPKARRSRRRSHGGGNVSPLLIGGLALGASYLLGPKGPAAIRDNIAKVPGSATFGGLAVLGAAGLAYDRFYKRNKYARALGIIGVVGAAVQVGTAGTDFKWVGDDEGIADVGDDFDVSDVEDVGDEDDVGDYEE